MKNLAYSLGAKVEEIILVCIILLNIFDFLEILPGDLDYIKKIISWTALGYLLYKASFTKIFFGESHTNIDFFIIISYFSLILKNFVAYSAVAIQESSARLMFFYSYVIYNAHIFEQYTFYFGGIMIILVSLYAAMKFDIKAPSLMEAIHEEGPRPTSFSKFIIRFISIFLVLVSFFVIVFNLMMEWLALAVDAPLVMFALFFYIFKAKSFGPKTILFKIGNAGEDFYSRFIDLFHTKSKIFLGISGMLVLHLLTDIGNFILPYIIGVHDLIYFKQLGPGHEALWDLFIIDTAGITLITEKLVIGSAYVFNTLAIILLLFAPAYLWNKIFKGEKIDIHPVVLALFFMSIIFFFLVPVFKTSLISEEGLVGADIQTQSALTTGFSIITTLVIGVLLGGIILFISLIRKLRNYVIILSIAISTYFFGNYIYHFFSDMIKYYISNIILLLLQLNIFLGFYLFIFFMITLLFYIAGFLVYIYELWTD